MMENITKEDIRKLLQEKKGDRVETRLANQLGFFALFIMILGSFYWFLTFSNILNLFPISVLIGSCLTGFSIFFTQMGSYLYYQFHEPYLSRHWLYQGVVRTFYQIFFFGSGVIIFIFCWYYYPDFDLFFILVFLFLSIPIELGIYCSRNTRIRSWFEERVSKEEGSSKQSLSKS